MIYLRLSPQCSAGIHLQALLATRVAYGRAGEGEGLEFLQIFHTLYASRLRLVPVPLNPWELYGVLHLDAYEQGWMDKGDFESRLRRVKDQLTREEETLIEEQRDASERAELQLAIS